MYVCVPKNKFFVINLSPPRLSSVSVFRVDEPTAVSRLMEWSVRLLQWERSSFVKWGMWRITRRRVESLMSRPASRKHCMVRSWLRLSQPDTKREMMMMMIDLTVITAYLASICSCSVLTWRSDEIPDLRVFDPVCIPQVQRTEEGATRGAESWNWWPGTTGHHQILQPLKLEGRICV